MIQNSRPPVSGGRETIPEGEGNKIMYRKQMTLQRVLCILFIAASVLVFIYGLGFMTDVYDMLTPYDGKTEEMRQLMTDMDLFDRDLVRAGIGLILVSLVLLLTNTHTRRRYYISNYVATGLGCAAAFVVSILAHNEIIGLRERYYSGIIDFEVVKKALDSHPGRRAPLGVFTDSPLWFDAHYFIFGILLVAAVLLVANTIWKIMLMKSEKDVLLAGKEVG